MEKRPFSPSWLTIDAFAASDPAACERYIELAANESDGCVIPSVSPQEQGAGRKHPIQTLQNIHVLARCAYVWNGEGRVRVRLTADDYYKFHINGQFIRQGPAPAFVQQYYYSELDVTDYLTAGDNVLGMHLYYQGLVNRVWNSGDGRLAMGFELWESQGEEGCKKRGEYKERSLSWFYTICKAYSGDSTGYDTQFLENFDSRLWDEGWCEAGDHPPVPGECWKPMCPAVWADYVCTEQPTEDVAVYRVQPYMLREMDDGRLLDFGSEVTGALILKAAADRDGRRIVIRSGEELEEDGEDVRYRLRCGCTYEETWTLRQGECRLEPYDYKGFRYVRIVCEPGVCVTEMYALVRHYPMDERLCMLASGDRWLDSVFEICKNGVKYGVQEGFLDCPTREKGQYLGDSLICGHAHVLLTGDGRMLKKCIDQFAYTIRMTPGMRAVAPGSYIQEIADFSLLWPQLVRLYIRLTGDVSDVREYISAMGEIIAYFQSYERDDGLLEGVSGKWNLVDWPESMRDGYDFELSRPAASAGCHNVINALYIAAVGVLEELTGEAKRVERLKEAFIGTFYHAETGLFCDSAVSRHHSLHANIYALLFDLCPAGKEEWVADFLVQRGLSCGVMTAYFYLQALARTGRYEDIYRILVNQSEHGWVNMIREGATTCWEVWGKEQKWNTSLCHPWAAAPVPVIVEQIAGFIPDPGTEQGFRFMPHIPEALDGFCLTVPFRGRNYEIKYVHGEASCAESGSNCGLWEVTEGSDYGK